METDKGIASGRLTAGAPDVQSSAPLPAASSGFHCWIKFVRRTRGYRRVEGGLLGRRNL